MQESFSRSGAEAKGDGQPGPAARSTRRTEWLLVAVAAVLCGVLFNLRGHFGRGTPVEVPITLVTSDREDLGCATSQAFGHYRCEYQAGGKPWPSPPKVNQRLAPYYSEDRRLFLIPGLFEQPALAARYRREDPTGRPRDSLRRFSAHCQLRLLEKAEGFEVRWLTSDTWHPSAPGWVAEAIRCTTEEK